MFSQIGIVSVPVKNQELARSFYTEVLGCDVVEEMPFGPNTDTKWIKLALPGGVETRIVLATWFSQMQPGSIQGLVLMTENIVEARTTLCKRGLEVSVLAERPYGLEASFRDPDGNGWVLQQPAQSQ